MSGYGQYPPAWGGGYPAPSYPPQQGYSRPYEQTPPYYAPPPHHHYQPRHEEQPDIAVDPNAFRRFYMYHLSTLVHNSKPIITNLTLLAQDHIIRMAPVVAQCLDDHLRTVSQLSSSLCTLNITFPDPHRIAQRTTVIASSLCRSFCSFATRSARGFDSGPARLSAPSAPLAFVTRCDERELCGAGLVSSTALPTPLLIPTLSLVPSVRPLHLSPRLLPPRLHLQKHRTALHDSLCAVHRTSLSFRLSSRRRSDQDQARGVVRNLADGRE